ncbi:hypothetical protein ES708_20988 [subsurface metagenome]
MKIIGGFNSDKENPLVSSAGNFPLNEYILKSSNFIRIFLKNSELLCDFLLKCSI